MGPRRTEQNNPMNCKVVTRYDKMGYKYIYSMCALFCREVVFSSTCIFFATASSSVFSYSLKEK
jgi:hypothetical protein